MKLQTEIVAFKPELKHFLSYVAVMLGLFAVIAVTFYFIFSYGEPVTNFFTPLFFIYLTLPFIQGASFGYSARKHQFIISDLDNPEHVADWAVALLKEKGMRVKSSGENNTLVLESGNKYFRMCNNWFGTEQLQINTSENEFIATGHFRYIDILDTRIKFGKVDFKQSPSTYA
jgi:hypothetical protein